MQKIVSIIIPSYNVERYIENTITSMVGIGDMLNKIEVLVINDGSQDKTAEIAARYEQLYPESIRVINKKNGGHGSTINAGIWEASGKYFKVVDGDDWVETDNFCEYVNFLEHIDSDLILSPYYEYYEYNGEKQLVGDINISSGSREFHSICKDMQRMEMHRITFRTALLRDNQIELDEHMFYVDVEYTCYPIPYVETIAFFDKPVYIYRLGNSEQSVAMANMWKRREQHKTVLEHLVTFYESVQTSAERKEYLRNAIAMMADVQYMIYLKGTVSGNTKNELKRFDKELKKSSREIYNSVKCRRIKVLRKLGFWGYRSMCLK